MKLLNYKKIILVGCISAFVAVLTSVMGVAGTIIGSVISSVLYNMLTEALEKPVGQATFSTDFEWDVAYVFPIAVIALIQLLLIFALFAEKGILPYAFTNVYLSLQHLANNNLYRLLGIALIVISVYPLILKPEFVKKEHGIILGFVGLVFLARGFVDLGNGITDIYDDIFINFDLPIAIIAFILLAFVIIRILISARNSEKEYKVVKQGTARKINRTENPDNLEYKNYKNTNVKKYKKEKKYPKQNKSKVSFKNRVEIQDKKSYEDISDNSSPGFNTSSENIHFESNDLLDEYKK